jgi:hypothetical protein
MAQATGTGETIMMKAYLFALMMTVLAIPTLAATPAAADLAGTWTGQLTDPMGNRHDLVLRLEVHGGSLSGTLTGGPPTGAEAPITDVTLRGDQLSFEVSAEGPQGSTITLAYRGTVTGNQITGTQESPMGTLPWAVKRR